MAANVRFATDQVSVSGRKGKKQVSENSVGTPRFRLFRCQGEAEQASCGAVGSPLDSNLGSNFALANRRVLVGV